ncbi:MAG: ATP-grasp domain-containing protein [Candidatus Taylorbacteria bacterium]|nr:ATP-grasp domain-containing protein [Candidatus Taylorbacteria bacterium]
MSLFSKIRVGVLRGGPSQEYEVSLKTGAHVLRQLPEAYTPLDIFIDKLGVWHVAGVAQQPSQIFKKVDVIWNALHGAYGEDGGVQKLLDIFSIPYTGSGRVASALAMHKGHTKNVLERYGIKTPVSKVVRYSELTDTKIRELFNTVPNPSLIKPVGLGSSLGVCVAGSLGEFRAGLLVAFTVSPIVLIEEYIQGKEATCAVVDNFRGEALYALIPSEIETHPEKLHFDYLSKLQGGGTLHHPGRFSAMEKEEIQRMAKTVHQALGLRHYSRSDFIVHPRRGVYFLEANSLPGLYPDAPFVQSLSAVGAPMSEFLDHVIRSAMAGK